jgi:hypothetical protein
MRNFFKIHKGLLCQRSVYLRHFGKNGPFGDSFKTSQLNKGEIVGEIMEKIAKLKEVISSSGREVQEL